MALGTYVEISTTVEDGDAALDFFLKLDFQYQVTGYSVITDGSININLAPPGVPSPMLRYGGSDLEQVMALDIGAEQLRDDVVAFVTPEGLQLMLTSHDSRIPMPEGNALNRTPISRLGKFGEYALPVADRDAAVAYWRRLGFKPLHTADEPYPWAILCDDLLVIGLHQTSDFNEPHITYFAPDMVERIKQVEAAGINITPVPPEVEGVMANAAFVGPGGQRFFLFQGEI